MEQPDQTDTLTLIIPASLGKLMDSCATFCVVECCGVNAFDNSAYIMLPWVQESGQDVAREALRQLEVLIEQVSAHQGRVEALCDEWGRGVDCATYLGTWRRELHRALVFSVEGCPSPAQRLRDAADSGKPESFLEVCRLTGEAGSFFHNGNVPAALDIFSLIAELDANDTAISDEVNYARRILAERGGRPTGG